MGIARSREFLFTGDASSRRAKYWFPQEETRDYCKSEEKVCYKRRQNKKRVMYVHTEGTKDTKYVTHVFNTLSIAQHIHTHVYTSLKQSDLE